MSSLCHTTIHVGVAICRYVKETVEEVGRRGGEAWLSSLQQRSHHEAWVELQQLPGVGAKVSKGSIPYCKLSLLISSLYHIR